MVYSYGESTITASGVCMPTIKDIAKAAGVSHGTVSNVLNNRGNVSSRKIELVEQAALKMGYNINRSAKQLRKGTSDEIDILIPDNEISRYRDLSSTISRYAEETGFSYNLYISEGVPLKEKETIKRLLSNKAHTIVIISCLNKDDDFYANLNFGDTRFVFAERRVNCGSNPFSFYSYDPVTIGENIARYIRDSGFHNIVYFSSRKIYSFENDIYQVLLQNFDNPDYVITKYSCDTNLNIQTAFSIVFSEYDYDVIVTTSKEKAEILNRIIELSRNGKKFEIITLTSSEVLHHSPFTECELDYRNFGRQIVQSLQQGRENTEHITAAQSLSTRRQGSVQKTAAITIASIRGKSSDALSHISRLIEASTGIRVHIIPYEYSTLFNLLKERKLDKGIDLIRIDMAWINSFAEELFMPLDAADFDFTPIFNSFIEGIDDAYAKVQGRRYTFPFDPSILLLFYRKDLFENAINSRLFYEQYRSELAPPDDFYQYNRIASFFTKAVNARSETTFGTTSTLNSPQSIACQFLPIYYSLGGTLFNRETLFLNADILKKAMEINLEILDHSQFSNESFWSDSIRRFASGDAAMSITFSNRTSNLINSKVSNVLGMYDFKTLPGEEQMIGGGVLGISRTSGNTAAVYQFLENFYSEKMSILFAYLCGSSSSRYVYENEAVSTLYPWMKFVQRNLKKGKRRFSIENYNELDFEYSLGSALNLLFHKQISLDECVYSIMTKLPSPDGAR